MTRTLRVSLLDPMQTAVLAVVVVVVVVRFLGLKAAGAVSPSLITTMGGYCSGPKGDEVTAPPRWDMTSSLQVRVLSFPFLVCHIHPFKGPLGALPNPGSRWDPGL